MPLNLLSINQNNKSNCNFTVISFIYNLFINTKGITIKNTKIILILILILLSICSLSIGVQDFSLLGLFEAHEEDLELAFLSRIPRLVSILVVGAGLGISGLTMQTIMNNKFISPTTSGIMEWAKLGILVANLSLCNHFFFSYQFIPLYYFCQLIIRWNKVNSKVLC